MAMIVKELIENSLDATARTITIEKLTPTSFTISDDGSGIHQLDYEQVAARNATSKITHFNGIQMAASFGFRGEALNAACAIADVSIKTRSDHY